MDIQGWLATTADRAPPDGSDDQRFGGDVRQEEQPTEVSRRHYHRKRQRASSDSSIIAPRQARHPQVPIFLPGAYAERPAAEDAASDERSRSSGRLQVQLAEELDDRRYERRPRHKTKPDRYEPKRKKHKKDRDVQRECKSKRRKSNLTHDGSRATGLVQGFQLKNGPKNNRLTLRPDLNAGLFKHGRASAQMTGRGAGLPDLVFNEMKFLEKPSEHQDHLPIADTHRQSAKEDRKRTRNEEISTYFSAPKRGDQERGEARDERSRRTPDRSQDKEPRRTSRPEPVSIVELPDKPFLGFGSRAAHPEDKESQLETSTLLTWSESAPRGSPPRRSNSRRHADDHTFENERGSAARRVAAPSREAERRPLGHPRNECGTPDADVQQRNSQHDEGRWPRSQRTGQAIVEVYEQEPPLKRRHPPVRTSPTRMTLQSLPREPDRLYGVEQPSRNPSHRSPDYHDGYHTSDILKVNDQLHRSVQTTAPRQTCAAGSEHSDKENHIPDSSKSSFSLDRMLARARDSVMMPTVRLSPRIEAQRRKSIPPPDSRSTYKGPPLQRRGTTPAQASPYQLPDVYAPRRPSRHLQPPERPSSHRETTSLSGLPRRATEPFVAWPRSSHRPSIAYDDDDEMLDTGQGPALFDTIPVYATEQQVHELAHRSMSLPRSGIFEAQERGLEQEELSLRWMSSEHMQSERLASDTQLVGNDLLSEGLPRRQSRAIDDGIAGFWKPHKLY